MIVAERFARTAITLGGIGTIVAVTLIFVFLAWVVMPLFGDPDLVAEASFEAESEEVWGMNVDEYRLLSWTLQKDGTLELHDLTTGARIDNSQPFDQAPTAASFLPGGEEVVFGFGDGTVRLGKLGFAEEWPTDDQVPEELKGLKRGTSVAQGGGIVTRTPVGKLRRTTVHLELGDPLKTGSDSAVIAVDHSVAPQGLYIAILQENGAFRISREKVRTNMLTGETIVSLRHANLRNAGEFEELPIGVGIGGLGMHAYSICEDGRLEHWDLSEWSSPVLYETLDLLENGKVTTFGFVSGKQSLVVGNDRGGMTTWFPAREEGNDSADPLLIPSKEFPEEGSALIGIAGSPRSRLLTATYASGATHVYQATLGDLVVELEATEPTPMVLMAPKEDAVLGRGAGKVWTWEIDVKFPEATASALFGKVQYEGYATPLHTWQSSSASDDFEPKLGMMPLVFGTLKATLYSLLFGAPLAILAAIFTSEFLAARMRSTIKSTVELMASLPSVVLGFIAALVIAPFVQDVLSTVLASFLTVPLCVLGGSMLWQMLPGDRMVRWSGWQRFAAICATLPFGVLLAMFLGPVVIEGWFFNGDMASWLDGGEGSSFGGWLFLLLPLSALIVAVGSALFVSPKIRKQSGEWGRGKAAKVEGIKFLAGLGVTLIVALVLSGALTGVGMDPRGGFIDTYIQRNAMIVGFAMGFAIVPIIYTLAEDALSEVPGHLREGSLGAGATQWQTAVRIVIPFAMSGLFSALMIGLGRAVGETMIVLMAAGNTPIMEWNVFNGFRTLSANIAVEMPEAVPRSAHYRTLFLAALVLFAMTFVLNTLAELVRRHFRARTQAL